MCELAGAIVDFTMGIRVFPHIKIALTPSDVSGLERDKTISQSATVSVHYSINAVFTILIPVIRLTQ